MHARCLSESGELTRTGVPVFTGKMATPPLEESMTAMNRALLVWGGPGVPEATRGRGPNRQVSPRNSKDTFILAQALSRFFNELPVELTPLRSLGSNLARAAKEHRNGAARTLLAVEAVRLALALHVSPDTAQRLRSSIGDFPYGELNPNVVKGLYTRAKSVKSWDPAGLDLFFEQSLVAPNLPDFDWPSVRQSVEAELRDHGPDRQREPRIQHDSVVPPEPDSDGGSDRGGLVVPGYNYVGPGNPLDNGPPKGPVDEAAQRHDIRYDELLKHGDVPYVAGHGADEMMSSELEKAEHEGKISGVSDTLLSNAARGIWAAKGIANKVLGPGLSQVLPPDPPSSEPQQPPVTGNPGAASSQGAPPLKKSKITSPESPALYAAMQSGQTAPSGGGLKVATEWVGGTVFTDSVITTSHTRISVLADRGGYVPIYQDGDTGTTRKLPALGMKTPYSYIDINALSSHFTPRDFQQLIEEYETLRPRRLSIRITGLVVKDVSVANGATTVSDSGSGVLTVFADEDYSYPYVLGHNQDSIPGHLPGEHYVLPQYAYLTKGIELPADNNKVTIYEDHNTALYFLEHHDAQCLTSGDTWEHTYEFPDDLPKRRLTTPGQDLYTRHNPLIASRVAVVSGVDNSGNAKWMRPKGLDIGLHPQNHVPGPAVLYPADTQIKNTTFDQTVAIGPPNSNQRHSIAPLCNQAMSYRKWDKNGTATVHSNIGGIAYTRRQHEESYEGYPTTDNGTVKHASIPVQNVSDLVGVRPGETLLVPGHEKLQGSDYEFTPKLFAAQIMPLLPGACWNPNPLSYDVQLWCKPPDTECSFMHQFPNLGGWSMETPPPMIFLRLRGQPGPPTDGAHTVSSQSLTQYAFFNLHYTIEWEVSRRRHSRRHNPEKPAPFPVTVSGKQPFTLVRPASGDTPTYEIPEHQWLAVNYSHLL